MSRLIFKSTSQTRHNRYYTDTICGKLLENIRTISLWTWKKWLDPRYTMVIRKVYGDQGFKGFGKQESTSEYSIWECADRTCLVWYHLNIRGK